MYGTDHSTAMPKTGRIATNAALTSPLAHGTGTTGTTTLLAPAVPKQLVHKNAAHEVLLTGWRPTGPSAYRVSARWPRRHRIYGARRGLHDPQLLLETIRQTFPLLSHAVFDVPLGHQLIWDQFSYALVPEGLSVDAPGGEEVELDVVCQDLRRRGTRVTALTLAYVVSRAGVPLATAQSRFTVQTPAVYQRLRAGRGDAPQQMSRAVPLTFPIPAARAGRSAPRDVTLAATDRSHRWQLRVDTAHPAYFDHPVDHVPGALLLDAAGQAAQALACPAPVLAVAMECEFSRYVELDRPCWVEALTLLPDSTRRDRARVTFQQGAEDPSCALTVTLAPFPRD